MADENVIEKGQYNEHGQKTGVWETNYPGILNFKYNYLNDKLHGKYEKFWDSTPNLKSILITGQYINSLQVGLKKEYSDKDLKKICFYVR